MKVKLESTTWLTPLTKMKLPSFDRLSVGTRWVLLEVYQRGDEIGWRSHIGWEKKPVPKTCVVDAEQVASALVKLETKQEKLKRKDLTEKTPEGTLAVKRYSRAVQVVWVQGRQALLEPLLDGLREQCEKEGIWHSYETAESRRVSKRLRQL